VVDASIPWLDGIRGINKQPAQGRRFFWRTPAHSTGVMRYSHLGSKPHVKNKAPVSAMKSYILRG
jgi:hypothetical protein